MPGINARPCRDFPPDRKRTSPIDPMKLCFSSRQHRSMCGRAPSKVVSWRASGIFANVLDTLSDTTSNSLDFFTVKPARTGGECVAGPCPPICFIFRKECWGGASAQASNSPQPAQHCKRVLGGGAMQTARYGYSVGKIGDHNSIIGCCDVGGRSACAVPNT